MRINFRKLVTKKGITKAQLSRDLVKAGFFKNQETAYNILQIHERGEAKSIDFKFLEFLMNYFDLPMNEIIED